jgi:hypothetical protein
MSLRAASMMILAILALSAAKAEATMIDSFDNADGDLYKVSSSSKSKSDHIETTAALKGYRDIDLKWVNYASSYLDVLTDPDPEYASNSLTTGLAFTQNGQAKATLAWHGDESYSLNADFSADEGVSLVIGYVNAPGLSLKMTIYSDGGTHAAATVDIDLPADPDGGVLSIPFTSFTQSVAGVLGSPSLSDIDAIVLELNGTGRTGASILLHSIETVPEPSTLALVAIGVPAFLGLRRRWSIA